MGTLTSDIRYALRTLRGSPGFTCVAVAALALGIGANTAIFTVVNGVMLQPLPYPQPDRLVRLGRQFPNGNGYSNSIPKYMFWRENNVFSAMTLYEQSGLDVSLGAGSRPQPVKASHVSKDYFRVFGVSPALGRSFTGSEDLPQGPPVAVLSNRVWLNRLGGDPQVVGSVIRLNQRPYTVVGVTPKGFESDPVVDVWLPLQADPASDNQGHYLAAAARLKPGIMIEQARGAMKVIGERYRKAHPKWMNERESVAVVPMKDSMVEDVRGALLILLGAVGLVLLIACANVANLLLARAAVRQTELAIRAAIGASRWRMVRQLLTESLLLAGIGGLAGFAIGAWGVRMLLMMAPGDIPRLTDAEGLHASLPVLDWKVAGFTLAVAALTSILFGLFPALDVSNPDLASTLKEAGRAGGGMLRKRARSVLVVSEVALALVLVIGSALLIRTFSGLSSVDPGLKPQNVLVFETSMASEAYDSTAKIDNFARQVAQRLEAVPGVQAVAAASMLPLSGLDADLPFNIIGHPPAKGDYNGDEQWRAVSAHYFGTLGIPLARGRAFTDTDTGNSARVVIINRTMAKKYWKDRDALGQAIVIGKGLGPQFEEPPRQVIGIVGDVREVGLNQANVGVMYVPQSQLPEGLSKLLYGVIPMGWAVRTAGDPLAVRAAVVREVSGVDGQMAVAHARAMERMVSASLARQNFNMLLLTVFSGIALLLAAIGIYGLMSYSVEQRMQEIGIRVALGAARGDVVRLIVAQGMKLTAVGVVVGLGAAYGVTRFLKALLFGVTATDPTIFASVAAVVTIVAAIACLVPARRAAAVAPVEAIRHT